MPSHLANTFRCHRVLAPTQGVTQGKGPHSHPTNAEGKAQKGHVAPQSQVSVPVAAAPPL